MFTEGHGYSKHEQRMEVMRRRSRIAAIMAGGGATLHVIMARLGAEPTQMKTIQADMIVIRRWWRMRIAKKYDTHVALQVARLERVLDELWAAWDRSMQPRESNKSRIGKRGGVPEISSVEQRKEQRDGNPKFMELIVKTVAKICDLLDLNPAKRVLHGEAEAGQAEKPRRKVDLSKLSAEDCQTLRAIRAKLLAPPANGTNGSN